MSEILAYSFMQRALLAAVLVGLLCSTLSFFVVLKKLSFLGAGISHTALGGIAIGLVTGIDPILTGSIFAVGTAMSTGYISRIGRIGEDTVIGIYYATGMALGIALISSFKGYYPELFALLFGNILSVTAKDLIFMALVLVLVLFFVVLFFRELLAICFDEEMAIAGGLPVTFIYMGLLASMGLTIMVSIQLVGVVLVAALVVIPGAIANRLSKNYRIMLFMSLIVGLGGSIGGLFISYFFPVPPGAAIVLILAFLFALAMVIKPLIENLCGYRKN
ncbi:MAG: metal ABC transporter permease [Dethiobacteria bacterium]|nr:metal ABC transporter permease [Bacillota bacterium]